MKWVQQVEPNGCGIACLSMLTRIAYADVRAWFGIRPNVEEGLYWWELEAFLTEHGYATAVKKQYRRESVLRRSDEWPVQPFADRHLVELRVFTNNALCHFVCMQRDGTVLDPLSDAPKRLSDYAEVYRIAAVCRYA